MQITLCFVILPSKIKQVSFGKEIYTLLLQNDIVTIPGFGAFVSEYRPAEINDNSDEIKPPSKAITFNDHLKNNDGLLIGHIAEKLHISHFDALLKVEKERDEILFQLDKGDEVFIEGVGTLSYNEQGKISFSAAEDENMLLDSFGLEALSVDEPEPKETIELEQEPEPEAKDILTEKSDEEPSTEIQSAAAKPVEIEAEQTNSEAGWDKTAKEKSPQQITETEPVEQEEKKKKKAWLFLLILVPLIAVAGFIWWKGQNPAPTELNHTNNTLLTEETEPTAEVNIDTLATDTVTVFVQDSLAASDTSVSSIEEEVIPAEIQSADSIRYYLVGGSFSVKENADNYLLELQQKGYEAFHVGKKGRFFIIGIGSYKTFDAAERAKNEYMNNNPGAELWVYKK